MPFRELITTQMGWGDVDSISWTTQIPSKALIEPPKNTAVIVVDIESGFIWVFDKITNQKIDKVTNEVKEFAMFPWKDGWGILPIGKLRLGYIGKKGG